MNGILYRINYFHAPLIKEKADDHLILESIRNKVWNPVFTVGSISFFLSMTLRGFFDQYYAIIPLAISTFLLFSGVWILSATALVVFDKKESKVYFVYRHLGYLQKIYMHPLTSFEAIELLALRNGKYRLQLHKDDGEKIRIADHRDQSLLQNTGSEIASCLNLPLKSF